MRSIFFYLHVTVDYLTKQRSVDVCEDPRGVLKEPGWLKCASRSYERGKERGILKEPKPRVQDTRLELTPQVSKERLPASPQPSVDRLSVTWAEPDPSSMASSANLFHLPSEPASEVKFSSTAGEGSEDEDYSASLSAVLRQRRASVRRSRKGRTRRPSSPFLPDESRPRRRSSVFTTSSGDTAISMEESQPAVVSQEQIFENIRLHKEVLGSVKQQPLGMRRKLKLVHQAKAYIKRHEGQLQERLAQSKSTRDIYARLNILLNTKWQQMKREAANTSNLLIPWELRIKEIESHFGSVVASYFTFLRWLFWVNLVIAFILLVFVIVPECLTANPQQDPERKIIMDEEKQNASNLLTLWEFEGVLKFSPIFYGYYSNVERPEYRMPLAYFLTGLVVYIYSFVAILRKMAENSRMSKLSEKDDECIFSWKLFTGWDFMIGNAETAHNRIASVILGFKEALLEEAEKKKDLRNWRIISLRALVNICVVILLVASAFAVVHVVSQSDDNSGHSGNWWSENQTTIVVTVISITFPVFFELLGFLEHYHPRKQLRLQLARIMLLNLLNLYSLIFALFSKIEGMSRELDALKPTVIINGSNTLYLNESILNLPMECYEVRVSCAPCNISLTTFYPEGSVPIPISTAQIITLNTNQMYAITTVSASASPLVSTTPATIAATFTRSSTAITLPDNIAPNPETVTESPEKRPPQNLLEMGFSSETATEDPTEKQLKLIKEMYLKNSTTSSESVEDESESYSFYDEDVSSETTITNSSDSAQTTFNFSESNLMTSTVDTELKEKIASTKTDTEAEVSISLVETVTSSTVMEAETTELNYTVLMETDFAETKNSTETRTSIVIENPILTEIESTITDNNITVGLHATESTENESQSTMAYENATVDSIESNETENTNVTETDNYGIVNLNTTESTVLANSPLELELSLISDAIVFLTAFFTNSNYTKIDPNNTTKTNLSSSAENTITETNEIITNDDNDVNSPYTRIANTVTEPTVSDVTKMNKNTTAITAPSNSSIISSIGFHTFTVCPNITFNCTMQCEGRNVTHVFIISNCTLVENRCYKRICNLTHSTNTTLVNTMRVDDPKRKTYNLTKETKKRLLKLCWETMFGQELVKLTMMDLVFVLLGTLFMDFFRALFVRYMNRCWCWDLEKKFPEYGDFKIAENILHLINNQGMVWMGMFFSPGLVVLNVCKLMIMMYLRSWAVMTCNVPHEVVFRVSKSNNFYLSLLLTMLFLCVLPVGYTIVWVKPSWHCGPFSEYDKIYYILTSNIYKILPKTLNFALEYIASPAIVIPLLVLLVLIIYYLTSLTNSLREANNDLKIQLRRERTEERRKMFQLADTRRSGISALDNTPFARWKKALPALPLNKSVDSDDRKTITEEGGEPVKTVKKRGGLLAKIVGLALDKKTEDVVSDDVPPSPNNVEDETDTDFHETLPKEILKIKDITIIKPEHKKKNNVEFKTDIAEKIENNLKVKVEDERSEKRPERAIVTPIVENLDKEQKQLERKQTTDSTSSKQSDSFSSVIPVITISTTESDDELLHSKKETKNKKEGKAERVGSSKKATGLRRQSSIDSANEPKPTKEKKSESLEKYQHSL